MAASERTTFATKPLLCNPINTQGLQILCCNAEAVSRQPNHGRDPCPPKHPHGGPALAVGESWARENQSGAWSLYSHPQAGGGVDTTTRRRISPFYTRGIRSSP